MTQYNGAKNESFIQSAWEIVRLLVVLFAIRTIFFGLYQVPTGSMEVTMLVGERFLGDKLSMWLRDPQRGEIVAFNDPQYVYSSNPFKRLFQQYVWGPINLTKRVIGVPGDRIRGIIQDGRPVIYINDQLLEEPYLNPYPLLGVRKSNGDFKFVTYDPTKSYNDQEYYRIDAAFVVRVNPALRDPNFTVTADGQILEMPGVAIVEHSRSSVVRHGRNFWGKADEFYVELGPDEFWMMGDNRRGSKDSRSFGTVKRDSIHALIRWRIWSNDSDESWWIWDLIKHPIDFWYRMRWSRFFTTMTDGGIRLVSGSTIAEQPIAATGA